MKVDVIIPAYNCHATLNRALASCAYQILDEGDELVVTIVNDADEPGYENYADFWANLMEVQLINRNENGGPGLARQTGVDMTDGTYIMFLDADDVLASPVAVRTLLREMKKNNYDVIMGEFIEETPTGAFVNHGENWIWMHGKMIRRRVLERFLLRFNDTRSNEDVGYLSVLKNLTDRTKYVPQVVYMWINTNGSLVRGDSNGYRYGYGWRGFIENMAWAAEEMRKRYINKALIRDHVAYALCRIYYNYEDSRANMPDENKENWKKVQNFYKRAVLPIIIEGGLSLDFMKKTMQKLQRESDNSTIIPKTTYTAFLTKLGFFDDFKKYCEQEDEADDS